MSRAFTLAALLCLAASAATAAPVGYYPSLGYGQTRPGAAPPFAEAPRIHGPRGGWTQRHVPIQGEHLPDSFFANAGGVGPALDYGGETRGYLFVGRIASVNIAGRR